MTAKAHELKPSALFNVANARRGGGKRVDADAAKRGIEVIQGRALHSTDDGEWLYRARAVSDDRILERQHECQTQHKQHAILS